MEARLKLRKITSIALYAAFFIFMVECMPSQAQMQPPGLGRTQNQILSKLEEYFPHVEDSTPVHGKPRRMGQTSDSLAWIEIIGDPKNVYSAGVMIGIPNDAPAILIRNTAICLMFMKNTLPHWQGRVDWFNSALKRITASSEKTSEEVEVGGATVSLILIKELGLCTLSIKSNR